MIRKKKRYVRPKKLYEKARIEEENQLMERYGLKNKKEIWKMLAKVSYFRRRAKSLARSSPEEQEVLFEKLRRLGLRTNTIADVLALTIEKVLQRRLPTIVNQKGLANTVLQARQFVIHKKVLINGKVVNVPSYFVPIEDEGKITIKPSKKPLPQQSVEVKEKETL